MIQINRISEVLAEAFAKVKFITDEYITAHEQEKKNHREKAKESLTKKQHKEQQEPHKPNKNEQNREKPIPKKEPVAEEHPKESKKEQKKQKEQRKEFADRPKRPISAFFRFNAEKLNEVKSEYP